MKSLELALTKQKCWVDPVKVLHSDSAGRKGFDYFQVWPRTFVKDVDLQIDFLTELSSGWRSDIDFSLTILLDRRSNCESDFGNPKIEKCFSLESRQSHQVIDQDHSKTFRTYSCYVMG